MFLNVSKRYIFWWYRCFNSECGPTWLLKVANAHNFDFLPKKMNLATLFSLSAFWGKQAERDFTSVSVSLTAVYSSLKVKKAEREGAGEWDSLGEGGGEEEEKCRERESEALICIYMSYLNIHVFVQLIQAHSAKRECVCACARVQNMHVILLSCDPGAMFT